MKLKIFAIFTVLLVLGIFTNFSSKFSSKAKGDNFLDEVAKYKNWSKVNKENENYANKSFQITDSAVAG